MRQKTLPLFDVVPEGGVAYMEDMSTATQPVISGRSDSASIETTSAYEPISSVWEGSDGDLLEAMFKFYAVTPPEPILDATYNAGRVLERLHSRRCFDGH